MQLRKLYDATTSRALERVAIEQYGMVGLDLMRRAGAAAFAELQRRWPGAGHIAVVCGCGNNAGDGFVVAGLAHAAGLDVALFVVGDRGRIAGDARVCFDHVVAAGVTPQALPTALIDAEIVVDALFGTGLSRQLGGAYADAIDVMNAARCPRLALDLPSGLDASSGKIMGHAVQADVTVTFIAHKQGLLTGDGPGVSGDIVFAGLAVPEACYEAVEATATYLDYSGVIDEFPVRPRTAHKGSFGHVVVVGGAPGYGGAARMAAEAAARCGAGLVSLATHPAHAASLANSRPEIMCHGIADAIALKRVCAKATVLALGPGLGQDAWGREMLAAVRDLKVVQVLDADALNLLASEPDNRVSRVLTPHPGEAARLLGTTTTAVQENRLASARRLSERYGGVVVLKGAGSVVHTAGRAPIIIGGGNPGMAGGGMGDVLTGIIAGLLAQHFAPLEATAVGACVHAHAADLAASEFGERGLLAGDLGPYIRRAVNPRP